MNRTNGSIEDIYPALQEHDPIYGYDTETEIPIVCEANQILADSLKSFWKQPLLQLGSLMLKSLSACGNCSALSHPDAFSEELKASVQKYF